MLFGGIDIGAVATKGVVIDEQGGVLSAIVTKTGASGKTIGEAVMKKVVAEIGKSIKDLDSIVATGYGRLNAPFASKQITEISCHAKGAFSLFPDTRTIIDIGGQDSKAIHLNEHSDVADFVMNDKCAAGTGRFLEVMADVLEAKIDELGELSLKSKNNVEISSMCTVFAESEVVSLIAEGCAREDIAMGLHNSIADRVIGLANRVKMLEAVTLSGGVINNVGVVHAIKSRLGISVNIPENPQIIGALGAALFAKEIVTKKISQDIKRPT